MSKQTYNEKHFPSVFGIPLRENLKEDGKNKNRRTENTSDI